MWLGSTPVALKKLKDEENIKDFEKEFVMLMKLNHPSEEKSIEGLFAVD
jgi:hypothetical protein